MYPHNFILELLAEYGIVGTSLFLLLPAYIIVTRKQRIFSITGNNVTESALFYTFLYFLVTAMFTGGLRGSWPLVFFIGMLHIESQNDKSIKLKSSEECFT